MAKKYIKNFYNRDRLALTSISRCGYCNKEQIKEFIADKRITNYLRDGIVIKETFRRIVKLSATLSLFFVKCF